MSNSALENVENDLIDFSVVETLRDIDTEATPLAKYYEFKTIKTMKEFHEKVSLNDIEELFIYFQALKANYDNIPTEYSHDKLLTKFTQIKSILIDSSEEIFI